ncbi:hypothetical protein [Vreelandella titanicae]|uniref:hypothetical protein n=1 Tax=Vreelandella titanicae TaxID=664683 RepID=UPI00241F3E55|nr:hypothetical protein [Halomonas titanicae]
MKAFAGITIIIAALLAGCESGDVKIAKEAVANQLRDPESAQFRNISETANNLGMATVCGEVNGKNSYGGYVGYQRFVSQADGDNVYLENAWNTFDSVWSRHCSKA